MKRINSVLTFDVGGSSIRAGIFNFKGELLKMMSCPMDTVVSESDWVEVDPEIWWASICTLASDLLSETETTIMGIAISGIARTQIFLDANGNVLRPAMMFRDGRATKEAAHLSEIIESLEMVQRFGGNSPISAFHPVARIMWVKYNEPDILEKTCWVLQPKDYLNYKLTGAAGGDIISSNHFIDHKTMQVPEPLFEALKLDGSIIPQLSWPESKIGKVNTGLPKPFDRLTGIPVFTGSMDGWCCALGIGANRPGFAYNVAGTTEVVGVVTKKPVSAPGLVTVPWGDGMTQIGGPTQAGGDCLKWFSEAFSIKPAHSSPEVSKPHSSLPPIFLPYLLGERTPLWDPSARGVFFGIHRSHTTGDFNQAIQEGVSFANRHILEIAKDATSEPLKEIRITGGAAQSDHWCQIKSDITGYEVVRTSQREAGLFGTALVALHGLGIYKDRQSLQAELIRDEKRFFPDAARHLKYRKVYEIYRSLYIDLKGSFQKLASIREDLATD
jgi:xylulokinase